MQSSSLSRVLAEGWSFKQPDGAWAWVGVGVGGGGVGGVVVTGTALELQGNIYPCIIQICAEETEASGPHS